MNQSGLNISSLHVDSANARHLIVPILSFACSSPVFVIDSLEACSSRFPQNAKTLFEGVVFKVIKVYLGLLEVTSVNLSLPWCPLRLRQAQLSQQRLKFVRRPVQLRER